jgi:4-amino-4-deoxy-L-arabinose transferase-like glycosyltransferase
MAEIPKGTSFAAYQLVAVLLNALPILPCYLFAASASGRRRREAGAILLLLLIASPIFVQNVTFVWTKSFAAFFALLGLWFYLRGWMKGDRARLTFGFLLVTAGCLVHLYVAAWLILLAAHYLLVVWPTRPRRLREAATIFVLCDLLLSTWFGWAVHIFGTDVAFNSDLLNPFPGLHNMDAPSRISGNIIDTFVPYFLRNAPYEQWQQTNRWGVVRDAAFDLYQTNAIFALGSAGAVLLVWAMLSRAAPWRCWAPRLKQFWAAFAFWTTLIGLCMVPLPEAWGAAHLAMLPLILLGICVLSAVAPRMPRRWLICLLVGCAVDFVLGIFLQAHLENIGFLAGPTPAILSRSALSNFQLKESYHLIYVGDAKAAAAPLIELAICLLFIVLLVRAARVIRSTGRG